MARQLTAEAFLVRRVEYAEADLIVTFFTRELGKVAALARGARKSTRRFSGVLEPFHTLRVELGERPHSELYVLQAAQIVAPRPELLRDLDAMRAGGHALSWVARTAPARTPEPGIWRLIATFLAELETPLARSPQLGLAETGLALAALLGWGLDFQRCVRCGKACREGQSACIDAQSGGLVCQNCGGARQRLSSAQRERLRQASAGNRRVLDESDASVALELTEQVLSAHASL